MLSIDPQMVIFSLLNFAILLVILRLFLYKPVHKMLEQRKQTIAESLAAADAAKQQADEAGEQIRAEIEKARDEAEGIIAAARQSADELQKQLLEEARQEAQAITASARAALEKDKNDALVALRKEAAALAVTAAGQILAEEMTAERQKALIDKYITEVGQLQ